MGFARAFREETGVDAPLFTSPDRSAYAALGPADGAGEAAPPAGFLQAVRAFLAGRPAPAPGASLPPAGVALVLPDGSVPWLHVSHEPGDEPTEAAVLAAVRAAAGR